MSRLAAINDLIVLQNGRKRLLQKVAFTTTGALTALGTVTIDGSALGLMEGDLLMLQPDVDCYVELRPASASVSAVTDSSGARPGVKIPATAQEFVFLAKGLNAAQNDAKIDVKGTAAGNLSVFLVR